MPCAACGEEINFHREVEVGGRALCIPCARGAFLPKNNGSSETVAAPKVLLIVGYKKVGKTTLIEKLIPELADRGYRVGTVKHHHSDFPVSVDSVGTDTWRHRQAGATSVALATPTDFITFRENASSLSLSQVLSTLGEVDIVLVEGFHEESRPKVEVISERYDETLCKRDANLFAIVGPAVRDATVPVFEPSGVKSLADLIERQMLARV
jgi:molybdopterin-guanine dinucleotide biosynthesis protein B